jgi:xanthine dehydrogenase accessory factor
VVVRGAGEIASGVIRRLFLARFEVVALERSSPDCIRRTVCYAEAVYKKKVVIEEVTAKLAKSSDHAIEIINGGCVPILVDPDANSIPFLKAFALVDGRMLKMKSDTRLDMAPIIIGLGPGFVAGDNCQAVVETNHGFDLGRVIYDGYPQAYTGVPYPINGITKKRVLRSPANGVFRTEFCIGDKIETEDIIGEVSGCPVISPIEGVIRGIAHDGLKVEKGQKIGDVDPRGIKAYCFKISDKANAVAGGVLEAIFTLRRGLR